MRASWQIEKGWTDRNRARDFRLQSMGGLARSEKSGGARCADCRKDA